MHSLPDPQGCLLLWLVGLSSRHQARIWPFLNLWSSWSWLRTTHLVKLDVVSCCCLSLPHLCLRRHWHNPAAAFTTSHDQCGAMWVFKQPRVSPSTQVISSPFVSPLPLDGSNSCKKDLEEVDGVPDAAPRNRALCLGELPLPPVNETLRVEACPAAFAQEWQRLLGDCYYMHLARLRTGFNLSGYPYLHWPRNHYLSARGICPRTCRWP